MTYYATHHHQPTTVGDDIHRRAVAILGKRDFTDEEYLDALVVAEGELPRGDVEELAHELLAEHKALGSLEAARILAEVRLGVRREPDDPVQATAERLARESGKRLDWIRDYRELAELYQQAERVLAGERTPVRGS